MLQQSFKKIIFIIWVSFFVISGCKEDKVKANDLNGNNFAKTNLTIISDNVEHSFVVEVADDIEKRKQGLMFRRKMADNEGMIFDFEKVMPIRMWMKNTYIPLDMLFISPEGKLLDIIENTIPLSEKVLSPKFDAKYVLEINGGISQKLGLKIGSNVLCDIF